jgi:hypothetical protein
MRSFTFLFTMMLCVTQSLTPANAAVSLGKLDVSRILFLGNSITYHESKPSIEWYGTWGMAASEQSKDYVHLVTTAIAEKTGATPEIMVKNIAEFEWNYRTYNITSNLAAQLAFKPTMVVLAIGENATVSAADKADYQAAFSNLLTTFKNNSTPTVFVRSCFWADSTKDSAMATVAGANDAAYVDISSLYTGQNSVNCAYGDPTSPYYHNDSYWSSGVGGHPGDQGMAAIANTMMTSITAASVPEPSAFGLLVAGVVCFWSFGRFIESQNSNARRPTNGRPVSRSLRSCTPRYYLPEYQ